VAVRVEVWGVVLSRGKGSRGSEERARGEARPVSLCPSS
jgi:hypothetical protein